MRGAVHMQITTIGLDIAKNVFQVHGIDAGEKVVVRKQLRRRQVLEFFKALSPCLIGIEACATSHYWARELTKLGHQVRLMPAKDVKAYVKRNKNDSADAEAICEAVRRPTMRFVQIKSTEQQGRLMLHRTRDLLMRQRTQVINAMRAHLAELGIVAAQGREGVKELLKIIASEEDARLPVDAHTSLLVLAAELQAIFHSPLFSGCAAANRVHEPGNVKCRDHRFWFPVVALFTGLRLSELANWNSPMSSS